MQNSGTSWLLKKVDIHEVFEKNHKSMLHEESLTGALSCYETDKDKARPLAVFKPRVCTVTGCTTGGYSCHILMLISASCQSYQGHWNWLITAEPHFYTRMSLLYCLQQEEKNQHHYLTGHPDGEDSSGKCCSCIIAEQVVSTLLYCGRGVLWCCWTFLRSFYKLLRGMMIIADGTWWWI